MSTSHVPHSTKYNGAYFRTQFGDDSNVTINATEEAMRAANELLSLDFRGERSAANTSVVASYLHKPVAAVSEADIQKVARMEHERWKMKDNHFSRYDKSLKLREDTTQLSQYEKLNIKWKKEREEEAEILKQKKIKEQREQEAREKRKQKQLQKGTASVTDGQGRRRRRRSSSSDNGGQSRQDRVTSSTHDQRSRYVDDDGAANKSDYRPNASFSRSGSHQDHYTRSIHDNSAPQPLSFSTPSRSNISGYAVPVNRRY